MDDNKRVCEICGGSLPRIGSWVQCRVFAGYVCCTCHCHCTYYHTAGSHTWCAAAYEQKNDRTEMRS